MLDQCQRSRWAQLWRTSYAKAVGEPHPAPTQQGIYYIRFYKSLEALIQDTDLSQDEVEPMMEFFWSIWSGDEPPLWPGYMYPFVKTFKHLKPTADKLGVSVGEVANV